MPELTLQIAAPYFTAGVVIGESGRVIQAAPIVSYMLGWPRSRVAAYAERRGWLITLVRSA